MTALVWKKIENDIKHKTFYLSSKSKTVMNEADINNVFDSIYSTIIPNIQKSLGKEVDHTKKGLNNTQKYWWH